MTQTPNEMQFLENVAKTYVTSESSQDRWIKTLAIKAFQPHLRNCENGLEFGCCDGFMTSLISPLCKSLTVVDGSATFIEMAKKKVGNNVNFVHALFEDFKPPLLFDAIFATYVLEHVDDSVGFLKLAKGLLKPNGVLYVVVPNARAMSRQLARHMGLIDNLYALTQNDVNHGHRRVYDRILLNRDLELAGLRQISAGGLLFKPLADFQMDKMIDSGILGEKQMDGLYKMGLEYPDFCGSIFSVCSG